MAVLSHFILLIFVSSYFLRFTSRFPVLGAVRFELILGIVLLIFALFILNPKDKFLYEIKTTKRLFLFIFYILISIPLVTWPGSVVKFYLLDWAKLTLFFIFIIVIVRTEKQLQWLVAVFLLCQSVRVLEPLYMHVTSGYWGSIAYSTVGGALTGLDRLSGSPYDIVNPNQLAWVAVGVVPFGYYLFWKRRGYWRLISIGLAPFFLKTILLTGSRSGLISLVVTVIAIVYFTKKRIRNALIVLAVSIPIFVYVGGGLGAGLQTRYLSLFVGNVAGSDTADRRIDDWFTRVETISHNPLFGNGLGSSAEVNVNIAGGGAQITHNLYIEVLQELGVVGFVMFLSFVYVMWRGVSKAIKRYRAEYDGEYCWLYNMSMALQVWLVMHLVYSLSCFGLRSYEWYFWGGCAAVLISLSSKVSNDNVRCR